jgi:hypothetical protein
MINQIKIRAIVPICGAADARETFGAAVRWIGSVAVAVQGVSGRLGSSVANPSPRPHLLRAGGVIAIPASCGLGLARTPEQFAAARLNSLMTGGSASRADFVRPSSEQPGHRI